MGAGDTILLGESINVHSVGPDQEWSDSICVKDGLYWRIEMPE